MNGYLPVSKSKSVQSLDFANTNVWAETKKLKQRLRTTQWMMERKLIDITLRKRRTEEWIREQTRISDILVDVKRKKWG